MGNKLSYQSYEDCPGPGEGVSFFKSIQVRWLEYFCDKLLERSFPRLDIEDKTLIVKWNDFFGIFSYIVKEKESEARLKERAVWHPCTHGYEMIKTSDREFTKKQELLVRPDGPPHLPDGYTDYAPSELSEGEEEDEEDSSDDEEGSDKSDDAETDAEEEDGGSKEEDEVKAEGDDADGSQKGDGEVDEKSSLIKDGAAESKDDDGENDEAKGESKDEKGGSDDGEVGEKEGGDDAKKAKEKKDEGPSEREKLVIAEKEYEEEMTKPDPSPRLDEGQLPDGWDPTCISPIFYGYTFLTTEELAEEKRQKEEVIAKREAEAVASAQATRSSLMGDFEEAITRRADHRALRIEQLKEDYAAGRADKEKELQMNMDELPEIAFKTYKRQWDREYKASSEAYAAELERLEEIHDRKTTHDRVVLLSKKQDLEAFKDAEAQEIPSADRLEEISRVEMHRWIEELDIRTRELERSRLEYLDLRGEVEVDLKHDDRQKQQEAARLINGAETRVRERQSKVEEGVYMLENAEVLLERSIRIKAQQDVLLPLFRMLSLQEIPQFVRFDFMIAGLLFLIQGTFDEKCTFLLKRFDLGREEWFTSHHIAVIVNMFQESACRLRWIPFSPVEEEINNTVLRAFLERKLSATGLITAYEGKEMLTHLISMSGPISQAFGIPKSDTYCTYQRNAMHSFALLTNNIVGPATCKYRLHYELIAYKPCLEPTHKSELHERAMNMGDDDPTRADYTKFIKMKITSGSSNVVELDHGHLMNNVWHQHQVETDAVVKLQALFRSNRDRRIADEQAKRQAFEESRAQALEEMRREVQREYKKRESLPAAKRFKWDAQVRMKQAKLRTAGTNIPRNEVVLLMMEEAVTKASTEVEKRFAEVAAEEGLADLMPVKNFDDKPVDVMDMFGIFMRPAVIDTDDAVEVSTPRPDEEDDDDGDGSTTVMEGIEEEDERPGTAGSTRAGRKAAKKKREALKKHMTRLSEARSQEIIRGEYSLDPTAKGETRTESDLRMLMALPEPDPAYFLNFLLANRITHIKAVDLMREVPSKRLLLRYIANRSEESLLFEIKYHFNIKVNAEAIVRSMKNILRTDLENGYYMRRLEIIQEHNDHVIKRLVDKDQAATIKDQEALITARVANNANLQEEDVFNMERGKLNGLLDRYQDLAGKMMLQLRDLRSRFDRANISVKEIERRQRCIEKLHQVRIGAKPDTIVVLDDRQAWLKRLNFALGSPDGTTAETESKWTEVRNVCREFIAVATHDAQMIVNEYFQPGYSKIIHPSGERPVHGRPAVCGRGLDGQAFRFEAHNITYRLCNDDDGICNGADEFAMKFASHDRRGSLQYFRCHVQKLNIPLTVVVDYLGFRVLCVAKLPSQKVLLSEEGEVRKVSEEMVHGLTEDGGEFYNKSLLCSTLLKTAGTQLGIGEHFIKGLRDIQTQKTSASADIKAYVGNDEEFYLKDFWRAFPPEDPRETPHLPRVPRDQSIYWRQLRPEFVIEHRKGLSPDAFTMTTWSGVDDRDKQLDGVRNATRILVTEIIPRFARYLSARDYDMPVSQSLGLDLTRETHLSGINVRHFGLLRSLLFRDMPGRCMLYFNERVVHTTVDLRDELQEGDTIVVGPETFVVKSSKKRPFTHNSIPINRTYLGENLPGVVARAGSSSIETEKNAQDLRCVLLAEMVARTVKNIIRCQLRQYAVKNRSSSPELMVSLLVEYFNVITGASHQSYAIYQNDIYMGIRERFGNFAITPSEKDNFLMVLQPAVIYVVKRVQMMMGLTLSVTCIADFHSNPRAFEFSSLDFLHVDPVVRHNIPYLAAADARIASIRAVAAEAQIYELQVLQDEPPCYLALDERKGARRALNKGTLGILAVGSYSHGCELEAPGPLPRDTITRSIRCGPETKSKVDANFHEKYVPLKKETHFSFEVLAKPVEGNGSRYALMSGRFGLMINRENEWTMLWSFENIEIFMKIGHMVAEHWVHIVCTYDGTSIRAYTDGKLCATMEIDSIIAKAEQQYEEECEDQFRELEKEEEKERVTLKDQTKKEAEVYFKSREGAAEMKTAQQHIMESIDFQQKNYGSDQPDPMTALKVKKQEAMKQAKRTFVTELYLKNGKTLTQKYQMLKTEVEDGIRKYKEEGQDRMHSVMRVGASVLGTAPDKFFAGTIAHVAIYDKCLVHDRILKHYLCFALDRSRDATRLHNVAYKRYEDAIEHSGGDLTILRAAAQSLCASLRVEITFGTREAVTKGKAQVMRSVDGLRHSKSPKGIAEILAFLPRDPDFAHVACYTFRALMEADQAYFSGGVGFKRSELAHLPKMYGLDDLDGQPYLVDTAARMYKEVMRDRKLHHFYGEVDLGWITQLVCSELVVALVHFASEDQHINVVNLGEVFRRVGRDHLPLYDNDVETLVSHMAICAGFDLSMCSYLTNDSLASLGRLQKLRVVILDGVPSITDEGLAGLSAAGERLEVLSLAGNSNVTDEGLIAMGACCTRLQVLNVNQCGLLTHEAIVGIARNNRKLTTISASGTHLDDEGLSVLSNYLSSKSFTSLDISFCREISDFGINSLTQSCPSLIHVNMVGLIRITDEGCRLLTRACWYLRTLNLEDVFLLDESPFFYDRNADGREAAEENMLKQLVLLSFKDCVNLTDQAFVGLQQRCRNIEQLTLRGCEKLTDRTLELMMDPIPYKVPMCDSIRVLDVSVCKGFTTHNFLEFLPACGVLEDLNVSGLRGLDDDFIHKMCKVAPTIIRLNIQRSLAITDAAMCSIADYLFLDTLNINYCTRITDGGAEVLALALADGLERLFMRRVHRVSGLGLSALARNCHKIKELDIRECQRITQDSLEDLMRQQKFIKIYKEGDPDS